MSALEIFLGALTVVATILGSLFTHKYNEKNLAINVAGAYKDLVDTLTERVDKLEVKHKACEEASEIQAEEIRKLRRLINNNG